MSINGLDDLQSVPFCLCVWCLSASLLVLLIFRRLSSPGGVRRHAAILRLARAMLLHCHTYPPWRHVDVETQIDVDLQPLCMAQAGTSASLSEAGPRAFRERGLQSSLTFALKGQG